MNGLGQVLAKAICAERYDCAEAAGWATCDHGFGYRDAKPLAAAILAHLRAVAADEGVRALREAADNMPLNRAGQPYEHAAAWLRRRADHLDPARPSDPGCREAGEEERL